MGSLGEAPGSREARAATAEAATMKPRPARFVDNKLKQRVIQVCIPHGQASEWFAFAAQEPQRPFLGAAGRRGEAFSSDWLAASASLDSSVLLLTTPLPSGWFKPLPPHYAAEFQGAARDHERLQVDEGLLGSAWPLCRSVKRVEMAFEFKTYCLVKLGRKYSSKPCRDELLSGSKRIR